MTTRNDLVLAFEAYRADFRAPSMYLVPSAREEAGRWLAKSDPVGEFAKYTRFGKWAKCPFWDEVSDLVYKYGGE